MKPAWPKRTRRSTATGRLKELWTTSKSWWLRSKSYPAQKRTNCKKNWKGTIWKDISSSNQLWWNMMVYPLKNCPFFKHFFSKPYRCNLRPLHALHPHDYTTQLYWDYDKSLQGSPWSNQYNGMWGFWTLVQMCWIKKHLKTQSFITLVCHNPAVIPSQEVFGPLEGIWMTRVSWDAGILVKNVSRLHI